MSESFQLIVDQYTSALRDYLASGQEESLHAAYELGRTAITRGLGVLDMVKIHQQGVSAVFPPLIPLGDGRLRPGQDVETFFMEALSPFEAHHRGFREANVQLRALSGRILRAQEEERRRISRELHDEVGQALTAIGIHLQVLKQRVARKHNGLARSFAEIQSLLELTMENVHRFSFELRPAMLDDLGLVIALRWYVKAFAKRTGIKTRLDADGIAEQLSDSPKIVIYRIAQESLTNIYKYAEASRVSISLRRAGAEIHLVVRDNGCGFDPARLDRGPNSKGGMGLIGMQERLRLVNGTFKVESAHGKGTTVLAALPFDPGRPPESDRAQETNNHSARG